MSTRWSEIRNPHGLAVELAGLAERCYYGPQGCFYGLAVEVADLARSIDPSVTIADDLWEDADVPLSELDTVEMGDQLCEMIMRTHTDFRAAGIASELTVIAAAYLPENPDVMAEYGLHLYHQQHYEEASYALEIARNGGDKGIDKDGVLYALGMSYLFMKQPKKAEETIREFLDSFREDDRESEAKAHACLISALADQGKIAEAQASLRGTWGEYGTEYALSAVRINMERGENHVARFIAQQLETLDQGKNALVDYYHAMASRNLMIYEEAIEHFGRYMTLRPNQVNKGLYADLLYEYASVNKDAGQKKALLERSRQYLGQVWAEAATAAQGEGTSKNAPQRARIRANIGLSYLEEGREGDAQKEFEHALHIHDECAQAYWGMARISIAYQEWDTAYRFLNEAHWIAQDSHLREDHELASKIDLMRQIVVNLTMNDTIDENWKPRDRSDSSVDPDRDFPFNLQ